jgi:hypothetical protein
MTIGTNIEGILENEATYFRATLLIVFTHLKVIRLFLATIPDSLSISYSSDVIPFSSHWTIASLRYLIVSYSIRDKLHPNRTETGVPLFSCKLSRLRCVFK